MITTAYILHWTEKPEVITLIDYPVYIILIDSVIAGLTFAYSYFLRPITNLKYLDTSEYQRQQTQSNIANEDII
uniref:Uncharacterized protein n=1 Tax=Arundo donax TaxID=35708 RepID=A0A0A9F384_ARUDO